MKIDRKKHAAEEPKNLHDRGASKTVGHQAEAFPQQPDAHCGYWQEWMSYQCAIPFSLARRFVSLAGRCGDIRNPREIQADSILDVITMGSLEECEKQHRPGDGMGNTKGKGCEVVVDSRRRAWRSVWPRHLNRRECRYLSPTAGLSS